MHIIPLYEKHLELFFNIYSVLHGKRLINWSKGLKKHFCLDELTEEEIIRQEENSHEDIFLINYADHKRTEEIGFDITIRNMLASDQLYDLEILLDNLGIVFIDLRKEKPKCIQNFLLNRDIREKLLRYRKKKLIENILTI